MNLLLTIFTVANVMLFTTPILADEHSSSPAGEITKRNETDTSKTKQNRIDFLLDNFVVDNKQAELWEKWLRNDTDQAEGPGSVMGELSGTIEPKLIKNLIDKINTEKLDSKERLDGDFYLRIKQGLLRKIDNDEKNEKKASYDKNFDEKFDAQYAKKKERTKCFSDNLNEMKEATSEAKRSEIAKKMQDECKISKAQSLRYARFYADEKRLEIDRNNFGNLSALAMNTVAVIGGPKGDDLFVGVSDHEETSSKQNKVHFIRMGKTSEDWDKRKIQAINASRAYAKQVIKPKPSESEFPFAQREYPIDLVSRLTLSDGEIYKPAEDGKLEKESGTDLFMPEKVANEALSTSTKKCQSCHSDGKPQSTTPIKWETNKFTVNGKNRETPYRHSGDKAYYGLTPEERTALVQYAGITFQK